MALDEQKAQRIWRTVQRVPRGRVAGYGFIADLAGLPGRARMVGRSLQLAPDELDLPWYRILRSNGQIAFARGSELAALQTGLLRTEGIEVCNNRVDMRRFGWQPDLGELMEMDY